MFTGIVREAGVITELFPADEGTTFRFRCGDLLPRLEVGHSISVDGVCLTVTQKGSDWVEVDATPETLRRSNLGGRAPGDRLNLEPPVRLSDFLGGHLVQGHVDDTGRVLAIREEGNSWIFRVSAPDEVHRYCVFKGSVTLNGISLTISGMGDEWFEVTIIPHTMEVTNMSDLRVGDPVNLEADVISKYVESHVHRRLGGVDGPDSVASRGESS
jgi:riboflavin synthase